MHEVFVRLAIALTLAIPFAALSHIAVTDLGRHVAGVAPAHPLMDGAQFGECVSELATTGLCPHEH